MAQITTEADLDKAGDLMDDLEEKMEMTNEMGNMLAQPIGGDIMNDDEAEDALKQLEMDMADQLIISKEPEVNNNMNAAKKLPDAPQDPVQSLVVFLYADFMGCIHIFIAIECTENEEEEENVDEQLAELDAMLN